MISPEWKERKKELLRRVASYCPDWVAADLKIKRDSGSGWLTVSMSAKHFHWHSRIEGIWLGAGLVPTYFSDCGPGDCYDACIHWGARK